MPFTSWVTFAYLAIKIGVLLALGKLFRNKSSSSLTMALTIAQGGEFAFVLFALLNSARPELTHLTAQATVIITLSMIFNPMLVIVFEKFQQRYLQRQQPTYDKIENEHPKVIIAGFGRFGQIFGRILKAQNIPFVAIDYDAEQIELVRRFGNKVFFGDATRLELLESAGTAHAEHFIIAIDDVESSLDLAKLLKQHFPHINIFARARNRGHAFDLMDIGVHSLRRETFDSALVLVQSLLKELKVLQPEQVISLFVSHDESMMQQQFKVRSDEKSLLSVSRQGIEQLADVLKSDVTKHDIKK
jgi:glutathione-regulated potassium-efflux system ancillary protein KefC